jgi:hypothetical protein
LAFSASFLGDRFLDQDFLVLKSFDLQFGDEDVRSDFDRNRRGGVRVLLHVVFILLKNDLGSLELLALFLKTSDDPVARAEAGVGDRILGRMDEQHQMEDHKRHGNILSLRDVRRISIPKAEFNLTGGEFRILADF